MSEQYWESQCCKLHFVHVTKKACIADRQYTKRIKSLIETDKLEKGGNNGIPMEVTKWQLSIKHGLWPIREIKRE